MVLLSSAAALSGWEPHSFSRIKRRTAYAWEAPALHAVADRSASGLIHRYEGKVEDRPILRWRWKVAGALPGGDETRKSGDDYAARVYVVFGRRAINYIWANKLPKGASTPNPYTKRVMMVAVRSGDAEAGRWLSEERDVLADYRALFGKEPPPYEGIAVMTDADDTGGRAEAWYADITLSPR